MSDLGRLERVDLRTIWLSEAQSFTPWLAREENLAVLGEAIGLELELEALEQSVGPFRADILCKDTANDHWVLIENQLARTDHLHLGQLLTYAAGLDAVTIVWIAARFTEEHRAALDWLNRITEDDFRFFGLEIELWRIGSSPAAPKFNLVSKPNDWSQSVGQAARSIATGSAGPRAEDYVRYWTAFREFLAERQSRLKLPTPRPSYDVPLSIGRSGFRLAVMAGMRDKFLLVGLQINDDLEKAYFDALRADQEGIERELGFPLLWRELLGQKRSRIEVRRDEVDPADEADWPNQHEWLADRLERFDAVFRPRVHALNPRDPQPVLEDEPPGATPVL